MWLFFAFLAVPLIEIALFIQIGGAIGLGMTLLVVVATAIFNWARKRVSVTKFSTEQSTTRQQHSSDIIDGDYSEVAPETDKIQTTSGWNKD